jgi:hypothetical protein
VGLAAVVHYLTLVIDYILYGKSRRNHLAARAVVVKLASRQGQNGHAQRAQLVVDDLRIGAERTPEIGIQVVFGDILTTAGALHEQADGTVAEHPHAYVGKVKTCLQKVVKFGYARFLEHSLQHRGRLAVADEHTVVGGDGRIEPQAASGTGGSCSAARIYTSPLTIIVWILSGARRIRRSYSGSCRSSSVCARRCPRSHLNTGTGVSILPDGA